MAGELEDLLHRASQGDVLARDELFAQHRDRLRRLIAVRLPRRLAARLDPSDLVQDVLIKAHHQLEGYLRDRPLPFYAWLRHIALQRLIDIHRRFKGGNISVAVIDSQIDVKHPDLDGVVAEQFDAVGAPDMPHSHGTGMAGAIFAHRKLMGIAPSARLYAIHAFSSGAASAESTTFNILKGLEWASAKGVRVINMSFAGPRDPSMERALKAAHDKGIVLIAAAGNAGPKSPPLYPGADPNVIAVTATDVNDKLFSGANRGRYIAVVSGLVALLLERNPNLGPEDVRKILTASARRLSVKDRDDDFGSGLVDPSKAIQTAGDLKSVEMTGTVSPQPPVPRPSTPARPAALPVSQPGGGALRPAPTR